MQQLTHQENVARQKERSRAPRIPITILLHNVRSIHNVGSIFRTAEGAGIEKIWLCGITGYPPNAQLAKTALGAEDIVPWEYSRDTTDVIKGLKAQGYNILALEQTHQSKEYTSYTPQTPLCLVIGHEVEGIPDDVLAHCDQAIEIGMRGLKNSLNVSVATGIAVFQLKNSL